MTNLNTMKNTMLTIEYIHTVIFMLNIIIPIFVNNNTVLRYHCYFMIGMYIQWVILDNKCILSIMEEYLNEHYVHNNARKKNTLNYYFKKYLKTDLSPETTDMIFNCISIILVLILTGKLKCMSKGIIWLLLYQSYQLVKK